MKDRTRENIYLSPPDDIYAGLRTEAERYVRRAIDGYAAAVGGSEFDLDETLAAAAVETLLGNEEPTPRATGATGVIV